MWKEESKTISLGDSNKLDDKMSRECHDLYV